MPKKKDETIEELRTRLEEKYGHLSHDILVNSTKMDHMALVTLREDEVKAKWKRDNP